MVIPPTFKLLVKLVSPVKVDTPVTLKLPTVAIPDANKLALNIESETNVDTPATLIEESNLTGDTNVETPETLKSFPTFKLLLIPTPP